MSAHKMPTGKIVLLYNDLDRTEVAQIRECLRKPLSAHDLRPWMASEDMVAFGDLFTNIEGAISSALGSIMFLGEHGLGRFQQNIEQGAVATQAWIQGARYGRLLVLLRPRLQIPVPLMPWVSVNHDGALQGPEDIAAAILQRFGFDPQS